MPSGICKAFKAFLISSLSSPEILLETPPDFSEFGIRTINRPASDIWFDRAAPFVPLSSFKTCIRISSPSLRVHFLFPPESLSKNSFDNSFKGRNPCLSLPKLTKAASRLVSTLETVALNILPLYSD